jgi:hypothetical protein
MASRRSSAFARVSPEARLLFLAAGPPEFDDDIRSHLHPDLDWPLLLRLARRERAAPVLWRRLVRLGLDGVGAEAGDVLRRHALIAGFQQKHLEGRLTEILDLLQASGLEVMLLKGAALSTTAYETFLDRPMGDIDLLLPAHQVDTAYALLLRDGWKRADFAETESYYSTHHHLAPLRDPRVPGTVLEVHRDLFPARTPMQLPVREFRENARITDWRGRPVEVPAVTHALLHLCIHFAWSHMMSMGAWRTFSDLHAIIGRERIDWKEFCEAAVRTRASTCCYWTLRLATTCASVRVPADVLQTLRPPGPGLLLGRLERHVAANLIPVDRACPSTYLFNRMWEAAIRPGWSGHGANRPWQQNPPGPGRPPSLSSRGRAHLRQLAGWRRYIATVASR